MKTSIAIHWRLKAQRYHLTGRACPTCHRTTFPPRPVCVYCAEQTEPLFPFDLEHRTVNGTESKQSHLTNLAPVKEPSLAVIAAQ